MMETSGIFEYVSTYESLNSHRNGTKEFNNSEGTLSNIFYARHFFFFSPKTWRSGGNIISMGIF